jgi:hypothetical protein
LSRPVQSVIAESGVHCVERSAIILFMIGFLVVVSVGLFAALAYVVARRARRAPRAGAAMRPSAHLRLSPPGSRVMSDAGASAASARNMVDVTPRGTSIKV